jgi:hypothetical protein
MLTEQSRSALAAAIHGPAFWLQTAVTNDFHLVVALTCGVKYFGLQA